jgi:hypothetical protein
MLQPPVPSAPQVSKAQKVGFTGVLHPGFPVQEDQAVLANMFA